MPLYKRGRFYWYEFDFKGDRVRESAKTGNQNLARQIMSARRTQLAKGEVGILDKTPAPTLREFAPRFEAHIETERASKPETVRFYKQKLARLLEFPALAGAGLDEIDEALIEKYKQHRTKTVSRFNRLVSPASVNRELATLRRLLRVAVDWKEINRAPRVRLLSGERSRDFVLSFGQELKYLATAPQPLMDVAKLILDTGLRVGEALALEWKEVHLKPAKGATFGYLRVAAGKSRNARRNVPLTSRLRDMLTDRQKAAPRSPYVFPGETGRPPLVTSLDGAHATLRTALGLPKDFVLHSLRHTMLTRLGEAGADAFTIRKVAGHSSVTVSERYVHPSPEFVELAFSRFEKLGANRRESARVDAKVPPKSTTVASKANGRKRRQQIV